MARDRDDLEKALAGIDERAETPDGDFEEEFDELPPELPSERPARHASPVRVVGIAVVLLLVLGAIAYLAVPRGGALEPETVAGELFATVESPLPFGFVPREARRLPSGERLLRYAPEGDSPAEGPRELTIIEYPPKRGESVLTDQFRSLRFESGEGGGWGGGRGGRRGRGGRPGMGGESRPKLQEKGHVVWHGYEATYARLRHGDRSGPWGLGGGEDGESDESSTPRGDGAGEAPAATYETVRVNLSTGGRCIVAYVRFADGATASKDDASALVRAFAPRS